MKLKNIFFLFCTILVTIAPNTAVASNKKKLTIKKIKRKKLKKIADTITKFKDMALSIEEENENIYIDTPIEIINEYNKRIKEINKLGGLKETKKELKRLIKKIITNKKKKFSFKNYIMTLKPDAKTKYKKSNLLIK